MALLIALAALLPALQDTPLFEAQIYQLFGNADHVALHDWSGDGAVDLIAVHTTDGRVSFSHGDGAGRFAAAIHIASGQTPRGLAVGDLDGDGKPDALVSDRDGDVDRLRALLFAGSGVFSGVTSDVETTASFEVHDVALADVDGDGDLDAFGALFPDAVGGLPHDGFVGVYANDGLGGFTPSGTFAAGELTRAVASGDFDGDGLADAAAANPGSGDVSIHLADGSGGLAAAMHVSLGGSGSPERLAVDDVDGDGDLDLLVGRVSGPGVFVLLGDGAGGFTPTPSADGPVMFAVASGDLDQDGHADLFGGSTGLHTRLGDGTGAFPLAFQSDLPSTLAVASADLDDDGVLDVVVGQNTFGACALLGDGTGRFADFDEYDGFGAWIERADLDGDGRADLVAPDLHEVRTLLGDGAGAFAQVDAEETPFVSVDAAVADVDGDGDLDVATAETENFGFGGLKNGLTVLLGDGAGGLSAASSLELSELPTDTPYGIAAGDVDGDGAAELAVAFAGGSGVRLYDVVAGAVAQSASIAAVGARDAELFDLDADGALDLAIATAAGAVQVRHGDGAGGFGGATVHLAGPVPGRVRAGDVDDDGVVDLVVLNEASLFTGPGGLSVLRGLGAGAYAPPASVAFQISSASARSLALADLDGDGLLDAAAMSGDLLVARGLAGGGLALVERYFFEASGEGVALGDFDGDGFVDAAGVSGVVAIHPNRDRAPDGVAAFGAGTPGCDGVHLALADGPAVVGGALVITCNHAPAHGLGVRLLSAGKDEAGTVVLGVLAHLNPLAPGFAIKTANANASGVATAAVSIPNDPALVGAEIHEQWGWFWTSGPCLPSPLGLSTSRGVTLTLQ